MQAQPKTLPATRRAPPALNDRGRLIKLVHVARRDLKLDEATYRMVLQLHGGADSSSAMSAAQLQRVLDHFKKAGFTVKAKPRTGAAKGAPRTALASHAEAKKARALWIMLHRIGAVRDPSETALLAYARRQLGVDRMEWAGDMVPLIESLKAWALRTLPAFVRPYLQQDITAWAAHKSPAWRDNWARAVAPLLSGAPLSQQGQLAALISVWELIEMSNVKTKEGEQQ